MDFAFLRCRRSVWRDFTVTALTKKNIIARLGHHFEKQDGRHRRFLTFSKDFCCPSRAKGVISRDVKFAG